MAALETLMDELYRVRNEVLQRQDRDDTKYAVYYGRLAGMAMMRDHEILRYTILSADGASLPNQVMGALLQADYGLPECAVAIHVDGKPYHTFSLAPPPEPSE